jgi:alpha-methylacyl-CoA racemase
LSAKPMEASEGRNAPSTGPLAGLRIIEIASIGPGPHCAMLLSDLGAEVLRIEREGVDPRPNPVAERGRFSLSADLRSEAGRQLCLAAADRADVLIEGFRPGVMERLGLGPELLLERNPRLIFGRMTGWGQTGPLAAAAGHDINYIALTGALAAIGRKGEPATVPLNLVGDFGGGSMLLAFGLLAALVERERSGLGQVVDAAIVDGASSLMSFFAGMKAAGHLSIERDENLLAGAAPFYRAFVCADGREVCVGAMEPPFYRQLLERIGAPLSMLDEQYDRGRWAGHHEILERIFAGRPAADWCRLLEGSDACFAPVVTLDESPQHPHMSGRGVFVDHQGMSQVGPVPRFSRTPGKIQSHGDGHDLIARWRSSGGQGSV